MPKVKNPVTEKWQWDSNYRNNPSVMPTLMEKWKKMMDATPYPYKRLNFDRCRSARNTILEINVMNRAITRNCPWSHSSPTVQKIKSVLCSGTKLYFVCVPWRNPLPQNPPEPMAMRDWFTCSRLPSDQLLFRTKHWFASAGEVPEIYLPIIHRKYIGYRNQINDNNCE